MGITPSLTGDAFVVMIRCPPPPSERAPADGGAEGEGGSDRPEATRQGRQQGRGETIPGRDEEQGGRGTEAGGGESAPEEEGDPGRG